MKSYTVFLPPHDGFLSTEERALAQAEDMVLVKEGFFWLAFLVPILWLLFNRMWLYAFSYIVAIIALTLLTDRVLGFSDMQQIILMVGTSLIIGFEAHGLKANALKKRGWREAGVAVGRNRDEAERDFLRIYEPPHAHNDLSALAHEVSA